jgi:putative aldouronate transport system substrate-binding protein
MIVVAGALFAAGESEATGTSGVQYSDPGVLPIVEEGDVTVNFMMRTHTTINDDYENNTFTHYMEELTGINIDFTYLPETDAQTKLNLLFSSGDYTDGIFGQSFPLMQQQVYADQGIIIPLSGMIEEYGVNTRAAFAEFPGVDIESFYTLRDGQMYALPNLVLCYHCEVSQKMWVYQPWLDALGLELPETTEEFRDMLVAFKTQDPNGNGVTDEIPLAGATTGWNTQIHDFIMNAFVRWDAGYLVYLEDGVVTPSFDQDGWREGLRYMAELYADGLIAPETFTQQAEQLRLLGENPGASLVGVSPGGVMSAAQINGESGRWAQWVGVPALEGPEGVREVGWRLTLGNESGFFVTDNAEEPLAVFRIGDLIYDQDIFMRAQFGEEDVVWRWAEEGELGINGEQGVWKEMIAMNQRAKNTTWYQRLNELQPLSFRMGRVVPEGPHLEKILYRYSREKMYPYASPRDTVIPPLIYSEADAERIAELDATLEEYINEMVPRFITGDLDVDEDWEQYLRELDAIGIDEYVELIQTAYDAKYQ